VPNANCLGGTGSEDFRLETHWYCPPPFLGPFLVEAFSAMTVVSGPLRFLVHSVNQWFRCRATRSFRTDRWRRFDGRLPKFECARSEGRFAIKTVEIRQIAQP
jgi:hypothetical protein